MSEAAPALVIDVVSDVVCPWCYVGKRRLESALALREGPPVVIHWRPFQLDGTIPAEGLDRVAYMTRKFGSLDKIAGIHQRLTAIGAQEGIAFDFAAISRRPDTLDSHRLIRWAEGHGVQDEVVERLFIAYFENGEDIGDIRVLADIADMCGMDAVDVAQMLEGDDDLALVQREDQIAHEMGVTGVPSMIFGNKLAVSGAREAELLASVIDRVTEMSSGEPAAVEDDEEEDEEGA